MFSFLSLSFSVEPAFVVLLVMCSWLLWRSAIFVCFYPLMSFPFLLNFVGVSGGPLCPFLRLPLSFALAIEVANVHSVVVVMRIYLL